MLDDLKKEKTINRIEESILKISEDLKEFYHQVIKVEKEITLHKKIESFNQYFEKYSEIEENWSKISKNLSKIRSEFFISFLFFTSILKKYKKKYISKDFEKILRDYFPINSNHTQSSNIEEGFEKPKSEIISPKIQFKTNIGKMIDLLDEYEFSPFYHEIDNDVKGFRKLGRYFEINKRMFSRAGMFYIIKKILKRNPFYYESLSDFENKMEKWLSFIIDYFNAIKYVFYDDWNEKDSLLRRNIGIYAAGMLISNVWTYNLENMNQDERVKELIRYLAKWKAYDNILDFSADSEFNTIFTKENKSNAKNLFKTFLRGWNESTHKSNINQKMQDFTERAIILWEKEKKKAEIKIKREIYSK